MSTREITIGPLHLLITLLYPASWVLLISGLIAGFVPDHAPPLWFLALILLAGGLISTYFGLLGHAERFAVPSRLREYLVMVFFIWILSSLFGWEGLPSLISLRPANIWPSILFTVFWAIQLDLQALIIEHSVYMREVQARLGDSLALYLRKNEGLQETPRALLRSTTAMATVLSILPAPLLLIDALLEGPLIEDALKEGHSTLPVIALTALYLLSATLLFALLARWRQEYDLHTEGLKAGPKTDRLRLGFTASLGLLALLGAALLSRSSSLVPEAWVARFLAWLAAPPKNASPFDPAIDLGDSAVPPPDIAALLEATRKEGAFDPSIIWSMLARMVPIAALLALLLFLIRPLTIKGARALLTRFPPSKAFAGIRRALRALFKRKPRRRKGLEESLADLSLESIRSFLSQLDNARHSLPKRRQLGRMTEAFLHLVSWAQTRGAYWSESMGPHEFCNKLAEDNPYLSKEIRHVGHIFEMAVYSQELLEKRVQQEYLKCVERIVKSNEKP